MHPVLRNLLAVVLGIIIGSAVNMGVIMISGSVIPPPAGADVTTMEGLQASLHLFEPKHFIMPWLAHALGTLAGALVARLIAANRKLLFAMIIGCFFLIGGIMNVFMLPSPVWFVLADLIFAYIPMAWIAHKLVRQ